MGGLALKHLGVQRINANDYKILVKQVQEGFQNLFQQTLHVIPAYAEKLDFGDCDTIVVSSQLPEDWRERVSRYFNSPGMVKNGDVTSIAINNVQFDFISVPKEKVSQAYTYFAYNDLGNLMGRVAHKMGFKYGHLGFHLVVREEHHVLANLDVSTPLDDVFDFLDYDYQRWRSGFNTLEDIFEYAAATQYFNPEIYLLHNRNAVSRVRDAKRKTYTEFLKWCENQPNRGWWLWNPPEDKESRTSEKAFHMQRAFERWPSLQLQYETFRESRVAAKAFANKFNGDLVTDWTNLSGKPLGQYMAWLKKQPEWGSLKEDSPEQIKVFVQGAVSKWLLETNP